MSNLTISFMQEIKAELSKNYFLVEDFNIETRDYTKYVILNIEYIYLPQYNFEGRIFKDQAQYSVEYSPGTITFSVKKDKLDKYYFLGAIREWVNNTYTEMSKTPIARRVKDNEEILKSFQEKINSMGDEGDRLFSREEGEELRSKLSELEDLLKESIIEKIESIA